jgi:arylsulfatase A-like enzyme
LQELFSNNSNISLYDLEKDPYELNNLAKDQSQNELLLKMNTKLNALMDKEVGLENHVVHLPGPDWFWTT